MHSAHMGKGSYSVQSGKYMSQITKQLQLQSPFTSQVFQLQPL